MRGFVLLLLSLMTGCEALTQVKGCLGGWVQFTCPCPDSKPNYKDICVLNRTNTVISSTKTDVWETQGRVSTYHDKNKKSLRVFIKQLQTQDAGEWTCQFGIDCITVACIRCTNTIRISLDSDMVSCKRPFNQIVYKNTKATLSCEYPEEKYRFRDKFFCRELEEQTEYGPICEDISSDRKFHLTETDKGFSVSISKVSSEDQGVYWCGLKSDHDRFRAGVRKINLKVEGILVFKRNPAVGKSFSYWCGYSEDTPETKFICKGDDPSVCQTLISSNKKTNGRLSMEDDPEKRNITIRVREVRAEDNGTYWCGAKSTKNTHRDIIYHKFFMIVAPSPPTVASTTQSTPATTESPVASEAIIAVIVCVIVLLLLLFLSVLVYKGFSKRPRSGTAVASQHNKENYVYEEIPERVQNPDPVKTVYATVGFPRNPSASLLYSTIEFKQSSDKATGDGPILKSSSSACEYSSVKPSPAYIHATHQSIASEEPLYSTVNKE